MQFDLYRFPFDVQRFEISVIALPLLRGPDANAQCNTCIIVTFALGKCSSVGPDIIRLSPYNDLQLVPERYEDNSTDMPPTPRKSNRNACRETISTTGWSVNNFGLSAPYNKRCLFVKTPFSTNKYHCSGVLHFSKNILNANTYSSVSIIIEVWFCFRK